jgi:hypothetical protein
VALPVARRQPELPGAFLGEKPVLNDLFLQFGLAEVASESLDFRGDSIIGMNGTARLLNGGSAIGQ